MGLFGKDKKADPKEQVNEWSRKIRKERNQLDRQIRQIQRSEAQAVASIKQAAKKNDPDSAKVSNIVFTGKQISSSFNLRIRAQISIFFLRFWLGKLLTHGKL